MTKVSRHPLRHGRIAWNAFTRAFAKSAANSNTVFIAQMKLGAGRVFRLKPCFECFAPYRNFAIEVLSDQFVLSEPH